MTGLCAACIHFSAAILFMRRCPPAVGRDEPKAKTIFGNGIFRPETFGRIRPQTADKPAILLPQAVLGHFNAF
jgi:hypothetical protein